jgi:hypothetical protein
MDITRIRVARRYRLTLGLESGGVEVDFGSNGLLDLQHHCLLARDLLQDVVGVHTRVSTRLQN